MSLFQEFSGIPARANPTDAETICSSTWKEWSEPRGVVVAAACSCCVVEEVVVMVQFSLRCTSSGDGGQRFPPEEGGTETRYVW